MIFPANYSTGEWQSEWKPS